MTFAPGANTDPEAIDLEPLIRAFIEGLLQTVVALWPIFLLCSLLVVGKLAVDVRRIRRIARSGIRQIDVMDGAMFEEYLTTVFRRLGYSVKHTGRPGDFGADLIVARDGRRIAVQAKCWSKKVGVKAVQEAVAAQGFYDCDGAMVVTNRLYSQQARQLAEKNRVELWGRDELITRLLAVREEAAKTEELTAPAPPTALPHVGGPAVAGEVASTTGAAYCVTCGDAVSEKVRDYCLARPARFGGRVYCFAHQRGAWPDLAPSD